MRIGAIFARGSCRALKWMTLFGVVFALGAGSAAAQIVADASYDEDGFKVEGLGATIGEGEGATITVSMKATIPASTAAATTVTVALTVEDPAAESPDDATDNAEDSDLILNNATVNLVFSANPESDADPKSETKSATVFLQTTNDADAEREDFALGIEVTGGPTITQDNLESTIVEDETQTYVLDITTTEPMEGAPIVGTVTADPAHVNMATSLRLHLDNADYTLDDTTNAGFAIGNSSAITGAVASHAVTITPPTNDENRVEDTVTASLYSGSAGNSELEDSEVIAVADINALPAVAATAIALDDDGEPLDPQPDMVDAITEGQTIQVKVAAVDEDGEEMAAAEKLSVMLTPTGDANEQDYRLSMHPVEIASGDMSTTIELTASEDQDVGMEMLMLDAVVSGDQDVGEETRSSMGVLSLAIMDTTMKAVEAMSDEMIQQVVDAAKEAGAGDDMKFSPGESMEVDASMLFTAADGYSLTFSAMSGNSMAASAAVSGNMVMVEAMEPAMGVHITVTATATMSSAQGLPQTTPNVAQVMFPVDVELVDLMVTLMGPDDMNISEGMSATITAMANRPVETDTMVELIQTAGTAAPADYTVEPLAIMAGEMEGTTTIMAVDDAMMEDMEMLTLEGRVGDMKTNTVMFHIWDAAVPALPIIAQLLLAAFLAIGGYRRYLRR